MSGVLSLHNHKLLQAEYAHVDPPPSCSDVWEWFDTGENTVERFVTSGTWEVETWSGSTEVTSSGLQSAETGATEWRVEPGKVPPCDPDEIRDYIMALTNAAEDVDRRIAGEEAAVR